MINTIQLPSLKNYVMKCHRVHAFQGFQNITPPPPTLPPLHTHTYCHKMSQLPKPDSPKN